MSEVQKMVAKAVILYLNGDMEKFERWKNMAINAYEMDKHLFVSIGDRLKHKGVAV